MATTIMATRQVVEDYQRLFVNRRAYTMQSMRPHPETGRHYYFRPSKRGTDIPLMLTEGTIRQHLEGKITVGLYAIDPSTQRCKWVAIDADYKNSMDDLLNLQFHLTQDKVEPALEMSKRGGHLWIFLATPLLAKECRIYIHDLALRLGVPVKGSGLADGIEVFPEARCDRSRRVWQRYSWSAGNPPRCQSPILVLRRRLHAGGPDGLPQPSAKSH